MKKVNLTQLIAGWFETIHHSLPTQTVSDLFIDSRQVIPGSVFVAIPGHVSDGRDFIAQAIANGTLAVLCEAEASFVGDPIHFIDGVPVIHIPQLSQHLATLAQRVYSHHPPHIVGVTGTNGKSTVTHLIATLAQQHGYESAVMGTLGNGRTGQLTGALNTTGDIFSIHRQLAQFAHEGIDLVAMEVSSHGLDQGRVAGVAFDATLFTNLTRDHLDYHGSMEAYGAAKARLFELNASQIRIINRDDRFGQQLLARYPQAISFGLNEGADWRAKITAMTPNGCDVEVIHAAQTWPVSVPLLGQFNVSNLLAALACLHELKLAPIESLTQTCSELTAVPGRMELFSGRAQVVVDYAHTPDALTKALQGLREHCSGQLFCIFGCGGDRDRGKRPLMAQAATCADHIIVTNDNPRSEEPQRIADDICAGFAPTVTYDVVLDRQQAIQYALAQAKAEDMILVAGKGHEDYQIIGQQRVTYDERAHVAKLVKEDIC